MAIPQDKFLDLGNLVLKTTSYAFSSQFYPQTDDTGIGGATSSTTAEAYSQNHESAAISTALQSQKIWEQFVDDLYSILKRTKLEKCFPSHQRSASKH